MRSIASLFASELIKVVIFIKEMDVMPYLLDLKFGEERGWPKGWKMVDKINSYQHRVLDYAYAYYELSRSLIADSRYDELSQYLVRLQEAFEEDAKKTVWWYVFHDFTGETGYHLFDRLKEHHKAQIENGIRMRFKVLDTERKVINI